MCVCMEIPTLGMWECVGHGSFCMYMYAVVINLKVLFVSHLGTTVLKDHPANSCWRMFFLLILSKNNEVHKKNVFQTDIVSRVSV